MELLILLKAVGICISAVLTVTCFVIAFKLFRADRGEYERNRARSGKFWDPLRGAVKSSHGDVRDFRVRAGLAIDTQTNTWIEQGVLSDEAMDAVLKGGSSSR
jgi:hypothetical protein